MASPPKPTTCCELRRALASRLKQGLTVEDIDQPVVGKVEMRGMIDAAIRGCIECLRFFREHGADLDRPGNMTNTSPLCSAASRGHTECVQYLCDAGASLEWMSANSWTPLHFAAAEGRDACVVVLCKAGAKVDAVTDEGRTVVDCAIRQGNVSTLRVLRTFGADVANDAALSLAAACGYVDILQYAFEEVGVTNPDAYRVHPLINAARNNRQDCLRFLHDTVGVDLTQLVEGTTPLLHVVTKEGHAACVDLLVGWGADPNLCDTSGRHVLHLAVGRRRKSCLDRLLALGVRPCVVDVARGWTPLMVSASLAESASMATLLSVDSSPAHVRMASVLGLTAFYILFTSGSRNLYSYSYGTDGKGWSRCLRMLHRVGGDD